MDSMDGTGEHYAKRNKLGNERQIPYDLTCKWNLINKTTSKQNRTRVIEIKNKYCLPSDSNQRGGRRGIMGKNRGRVIEERV